MIKLRLMLAAAMAGLLLGACNLTGPMSDISLTTNQQLISGIKSYEEGDYQAAQTALKKAQQDGLKEKQEQVIAFKYLAFIHCVSGQDKQCRDEFRKALAIDPNFELKPAEAGHPVWGPVFRGEKAKYVK